MKDSLLVNNEMGREDPEAQEMLIITLSAEFDHGAGKGEGERRTKPLPCRVLEDFARKAATPQHSFQQTQKLYCLVL